MNRLHKCKIVDDEIGAERKCGEMSTEGRILSCFLVNSLRASNLTLPMSA